MQTDIKKLGGTLVSEAINALDLSHPKNPENLRFAAAVMTPENKVFASSAFWSDTLTLAVHAEHAALVHAAASGHRTVSYTHLTLPTTPYV